MSLKSNKKRVCNLFWIWEDLGSRLGPKSDTPVERLWFSIRFGPSFETHMDFGLGLA